MNWLVEVAASFEKAVFTASSALVAIVFLVLVFGTWLVRQEDSEALLRLAAVLRAIFHRGRKGDDRDD